MTQIAFLRKADIPTNRQIHEAIQKLGNGELFCEVESMS
jgi:hypothetical protein